MKKNVMMTVAVLIFSLVGIIIGNRSFAYQDNKDSVWNIYFDNMKTSIINGNAFVPNDPEVEATRIKAYDVLISKKGDYATFTFDVVNDGTLDAKLSTLTKLDPKCISLEIPENTYDEELVCKNLVYTYYYTKNTKEVKLDDIIKAKSRENITIKVGLNDNIAKDPEGDVQITLYDTTLVYNK